MRLIIATAVLVATAPALAWQQDRPARTIPARGLVHLVAFAPDGRSITGWGSDGFVRWDAASGRQVERQPLFLKLCGRRSSVLPRSEDGATLAVNCGAKLSFFDIATGEPRGEWKFDPKQPPVVYTASPDGARIATVLAGDITAIHVGDLKTGERRLVIRNEQEVQQMSFAPGGRVLATGAVNGVALWGLPDGARLHVIPGGTFHAFSPDGRTIAVERGRDVGLFDVATGALTHPLPGLASQLRFSGDGALLAGWNNQQLTVWNTATGAAMLHLKGSQLTAAALSPDATALAAVGMELAGDSARSVLAIWPLPRRQP